MANRVLSTVTLGCGATLGAVAVVAAPGMAVWLTVLGAATGGAAGAWAHERAPGDAAARARAARRTGLVVGGSAVGGSLVVAGMVLLLGPATGATLLLTSMIGVAVWLRRGGERGRLRRAVRDELRYAAPHSPRRVGPTAPTPPPAPRSGPGTAPLSGTVPDPATLSARSLCRAWQHSYFVLLELPAGAPPDEVLGLRARLLDEIERRDPDGFRRWLDAGARAGSIPGHLADS